MRQETLFCMRFLELIPVYRSTMDDRLHTTTLLLHLIATHSLFSRSRIDSEEKLDNERPQRMRAYDTGTYSAQMYCDIVSSIRFHRIRMALAFSHGVVLSACQDYRLPEPAPR